MKTAIFIILVIAFLLYVSGLTITTNPFRISLPTWYRAVSIILFISGLLLYNLGEHKRGYEECQKKYSDRLDSLIHKLENKP